MSAVLVVALNTFRENRRDRILYVLVFFALLLILFSSVAGDLSPFESSKILLDVGQAAISLMGAFIAIFLGISLVSREIERRTIYVIVSKPVGRVEFLLGKLLGLTFTLTAAVAIMAAMTFAVAFAWGARPGLALAQSIALIWVELVLLVALSSTFATFTTTTLAAMFSLGTWIIGMALATLRTIGQHSAPPARWLLLALWWVLPDFSVLDMKTRATYGIPLSGADFSLALLYGLAWTAALLTVSSVVFSRRDFR